MSFAVNLNLLIRATYIHIAFKYCYSPGHEAPASF